MGHVLVISMVYKEIYTTITYLYIYFHEDVNECQMNPCDQNSFCVNKLGTYDCSCIPGFRHLTPYSKECFGKNEFLISRYF